MRDLLVAVLVFGSLPNAEEYRYERKLAEHWYARHQ